MRDPNLTKKVFDEGDVERLHEQVVYDGFFKMFTVKLRHKLFGGGWSREVEREIFHRGHAVAAVLYDPAHHLVGLVDQFRIGALDSEFGPWCLEVVAGMNEVGETPEQVIRRELQEEAGITDANLVPITSYFSTPGGCSEKIHLYCAVCDLKDRSGIHGRQDEDEDIFLHVISADNVFNVMLNSRANNAATLIGLQWLQLNYQKLQESQS